MRHKQSVSPVMQKASLVYGIGGGDIEEHIVD